jgi:hypothetical protein
MIGKKGNVAVVVVGHVEKVVDRKMMMKMQLPTFEIIFEKAKEKAGEESCMKNMSEANLKEQISSFGLIFCKNILCGLKYKQAAKNIHSYSWPHSSSDISPSHLSGTFHAGQFLMQNSVHSIPGGSRLSNCPIRDQ